MVRLSMHEVAMKRNCWKCMFASKESLEHNKKAHDENRWGHEHTIGWCSYPGPILPNDDGSCKRWKEIE